MQTAQPQQIQQHSWILDMSNEPSTHLITRVHQQLATRPLSQILNSPLIVMTANKNENFTQLILQFDSQFNGIIPKTLQNIFTCSIFPSIKVLLLDEIGLINCEFLSYMEMPNLEFLDLSQNDVSCVKSLSKGLFSKMNCLILQKNPILTFQLSRIKFTSKIRFLHFQSQSQSCVVCEDLGQVFKLEAKMGCRIKYKSKKRIPQATILSKANNFATWNFG